MSVASGRSQKSQMSGIEQNMTSWNTVPLYQQMSRMTLAASRSSPGMLPVPEDQISRTQSALLPSRNVPVTSSFSLAPPRTQADVGISGGQRLQSNIGPL